MTMGQENKGYRPGVRQTQAQRFGSNPTNMHQSTKNPIGFSRLLVGTCGYSYLEWIEAGFYPEGTQTGRMLPFYAKHFPITELNFTWYQMPRAEAIIRMKDAAPDGFGFTAKLTRTLTHEIDHADWHRQAILFRQGVAPLVISRQLQAVLVQLPPDFDRSRANRIYLAALLDELDGLPLAIEFRHRSWAQDAVFAELERRRATLVAVDEPLLPDLFPALDVVTNPDFFYVRFHGRNARGWKSGTMQKKFDYLYSDEELTGWISEKILPMTEKASHGLIFFNNHVAGQAPTNAATMVSLLRRTGLDTNPASCVVSA